MEHGSDHLKETVVPALLNGEALTSFGYTEPESGSDAAAATKAVKDGDEWVINGAKMWTTMAHIADYVILLTRTDPDVPKHKGLTFFLVPFDTPGIEIQPVPTMATERSNATFYDDVRLSDDWRVGEVNGGWAVMKTALKYERASQVASSCHRRSSTQASTGRPTMSGPTAPGRSTTRPCASV